MKFDESWYSAAQLEYLQDLVRKAPQNGLFIEIGVWQGRSAIAIASVLSETERILVAIDSWEGNVDEGNEHPTVVQSQVRDIYQEFIENVIAANLQDYVAPVQCTWQQFFDNFEAIRVDGEDHIAFIHIDAGHTYQHVLDTLTTAYQYVVEGGVMCGDDFLTSSAQRLDLGGGVERAVREFTTQHGLQLQTRNNFWWFFKS